MPVLFIHGVAVRAEHDPEWATVRRVTQGLRWPAMLSTLRATVAPVLRPDDPDGVDIQPVYWGDLGAHHAPPRPPAPDPADGGLPSRDALGEALEARLRARTPAGLWPDVIRAAWHVARDVDLTETARGLAPAQAWPFLEAAALAQPTGVASGPRRLHLPAPLVVQRQRNLSRALLTVRRPITSFVPIFLGDLLVYLDRRGTPQAPGPIPRRLLDALASAHAARQGSGEPLVVLTHSLGGVLLYDVLSVFLPAAPELRDVWVDFWCAAGSQVGPFVELGLTAGGAPDGADAPTAGPHLGYFWNVWSESDLLSFPAGGVVPGAHDTAFPLGGNVQAGHLAYLQRPEFYRALAAKVDVHTRR
ncbi:hypothetical protein HNQ07_003879 [Deinococcus metalli]|uniref:Alpha/beta hydrolase n=1 Tax=Deinococcus metalli TaxID=1141878 RepID=A0A7W8KIJ8_9DEIO|nr:hypothetical protein [Deinococcus metalli]MBB5378373.1 hypothetical protein [Deinococcus metalli]GHF59376.1 hypothetical protein GCM10017781_39580 [Deinococcus metalli]